MLTFEQFLNQAASRGETVNLMFEERLFSLIEILHRVTDMLSAEHIPYELVGGMAVVAQLDRVDPDAVMLTRDVDIMISRTDLERLQSAAERHGFRFRHSASLDMLLHGEEKKAVRGVHLIFSGESVKDNQPPTPALAPEPITLYGKAISVAPVRDLAA